jgi:sec-independent protein translocase protein TatC
VLLTLMGRAGMATAAGLAGVRKYAAVGILTLAAVVTPPDVITQVILFTVVYGLYEVSIHLVRRFEKKREAELREEGLWFEDDDEDEGEDGDTGPTPEAKDATEEEDPIFKEFDDDEEADDAALHGDEGVWDIDDEDEDPGMVNKDG